MKLPTELELRDENDHAFRVRFDYDRGEEQWFDARAGVGGPGFGPSVCITEVNFGSGWEDSEVYRSPVLSCIPKVDFDQWEQEVMDKLIELESDAQEGRE